MEHLLTKINAAADFILPQIPPPEIALILGSGLGDFVDHIKKQTIIPYEKIPHFPVATVAGHSGRLVAGEIAGKNILAMQGRFHYYEGYSLEEVTFPVRIMKKLGIRDLLVTNAAGGLNPRFQPGDLMLIIDHINFLGLNPLRGPNHEEWGSRFPDMTEAYDLNLRRLAKEAAESLQLTLHDGVYVFVGGPSYETPAEVKLLRLLGADAVGMSTVPEVIVANHSNLRVLGLTCITNAAAGMGQGKLEHKSVVAAARESKTNFQSLVNKILELM